MNVILSIKQFFFQLGQKPLHKMTVEEVIARFSSSFIKRKQQVEEKRDTIKQLFPLQKKEFSMRLEKASTDFHLKDMLALVTNMKKNWMFWNEGERVYNECVKSGTSIKNFLANYPKLLSHKHIQAMANHEKYPSYFHELTKSNELTSKHLEYLHADAEFIKKDLIKRAKALLESESAQSLSFEELFKQKKQWITDEVVDLLHAVDE